MHIHPATKTVNANNHPMEMSESEDSDSDNDGVGLIVPIQQEDVRRIVAGQVISGLASTVKELVDNALDSGSKSVNIRLFNQGLDVIEVSDFGSGVPRESRPLLAMKHATSKIRSFDEIYADKQCDNGQMQLQQLGFRGEALFSLANISQNLVISSRAENESIGQKMEFRRDGYPDTNATTDVARKVGTTVAVVKVFDALPVRRADLIKRIKMHRAKLLRILQAWIRFNLVDVIGSVGTPKCKTEVKMNTSQNSKTLNETVSQVFGSKFVAGLHPIRVDLTSVISPSNETKEISQGGMEHHKWRIEGLVSKAPSTQSNGKSARDIQFFSINGRPVDLPKISQVVADAWRNFESVSADSSKKRPACILRLYLPNSKFDINVAPDKREVLLSDSSAVYDALRNALTKLWSEQTEGVFLANEVESTSNQNKNTRPDVEHQSISTSDTKSSNIEDRAIDSPPVKRRKMQRRNAFIKRFDSTEDSGPSSRNVFDHFAQIENIRKSVRANNTKSPTESAQANEFSTADDSEAEKSNDPIPPPNQQCDASEEDVQHATITSPSASSSDQTKWNQTRLQFSPARSNNQQQEIEALESMQANKISHPTDIQEETTTRKSYPETSEPKQPLSSLEKLKQFALNTSATKVSPASISSPQSSTSSNSGHEIEDIEEQVGGRQISLQPTRPPKPRIHSNGGTKSPAQPQPQHSSSDDESSFGDERKEIESKGPTAGTNQAQPQATDVVWSGFSTSSVLKDFQTSRRLSRDRKHQLAKLKSDRKRSRDKGEYEEETTGGSSSNKLSLSKDDFMTMNVIGQFNLGFILALGDDGQLWILDQHACDEKYNFEKLCKETKVQEQKLIAHLPLELSPSEENCVLENLDIFEKNGFRFSHDNTRPPRHRLSLTAVPHNGSGGDSRKAVQFGPQDVGALCAILGADGASSSSGYVAGSGTGADGAGKSGNNAVRRHAGMGGTTTTIRLPKAVAMFASRACRSSIMIGESLSQSKMEEVVQKLNKLDHPWECAHGRPTIRHVRDLVEQLFDDANH